MAGSHAGMPMAMAHAQLHTITNIVSNHVSTDCIRASYVLLLWHARTRGGYFCGGAALLLLWAAAMPGICTCTMPSRYALPARRHGKSCTSAMTARHEAPTGALLIQSFAVGGLDPSREMQIGRQEHGQCTHHQPAYG
jgi:hypothetical protein